MAAPTLLLESSTDELLRVPEPEAVARAEAALQRAEATGSPSDAAAFVRESVSWLEQVAEEVFAGTTAARFMRRIRLLVGQTPLHAAFSAWRISHPDKGLYLAYVDRLREIADEYGVATRPLTAGADGRANGRGARLSAAATDLASHRVAETTLFRMLTAELASVLGARRALDEIRDTLDLSMPELGRVFRVSRQAVEQWRQRGVPAERRADVDRVLEVCQLLRQKLKAERIPQIVRNKADRLGGRSMLDVLSTDGPAALLDHLQALFSYQLV